MTPTVRRMTSGDLEWAVQRLAERRARLVPYAPLYWRPAANAARAHRRFLGYALGAAGGIGFRTDDALVIAVPGPRGRWTVDDVVVPDGQWDHEGRELWEALGRAIPETSVRFVCPTPETERRRFADRVGLRVESSWWQMPMERVRSTPAEGPPDLDGAAAELVAAPAIYDPGGPILFLTTVGDPERVLPDAAREAGRLGCPIVVVDQPRSDVSLADALEAAGFWRHCDFYAGRITA